MTIYSILNRKTQSWWHHRELRESGRIKEARDKERRSIRDNVKTLRKSLNGGWATVGRGGWTLHYESHAYMSGYGGIDDPMIQACIQLGIPVIDSTTIDYPTILDVISFPMPAFPDRCDEPPYTSMSYAPIEHVAKLYKEKGATLYNF